MERWYYNYNGVLVHHGIKGQEWGVRNGPPYPLSRQKGKRDKIKKHIDKKKIIDNNKSGALNFAQQAENQNLRKYLKIVGTVAVAAGAMYVGRKLLQKIGTKAVIKLTDDMYENSPIQFLSNIPKMNSPMAASDSVSFVNLEYPCSGYTMNCAFCTTAMALREKGYDVISNANDVGVISSDFFSKAFKGCTEIGVSKDAKSMDDICDELSKFGKNAYGDLSLNYVHGGHSVFWKNDENGHTIIYDGQIGKILNGTEYMHAYNQTVNFAKTTYARLDNCEPTDYATIGVRIADSSHWKH